LYAARGSSFCCAGRDDGEKARGGEGRRGAFEASKSLGNTGCEGYEDEADVDDNADDDSEAEMSVAREAESSDTDIAGRRRGEVV
jgi:hypothetical protein